MPKEKFEKVEYSSKKMGLPKYVVNFRFKEDGSIKNKNSEKVD